MSYSVKNIFSFFFCVVDKYFLLILLLLRKSPDSLASDDVPVSCFLCFFMFLFFICGNSVLKFMDYKYFCHMSVGGGRGLGDERVDE